MSAVPHALTMLEHALSYARSGLTVFPVNPSDKTPLVSQYDATTDATQIEAWWRRWPIALIGCRLPADRLVLDLDPRHNGVATWEGLQAEHGTVELGRWHASGRGDGGRHLWFVHPHPGRKPSIKGVDTWARAHETGHAAGKLRWTGGIDVLHVNHRYTILPPSPHPATGQPYVWGKQGPAAPMPRWLVAMLFPEASQPEMPAHTVPLRVVGDADSIADWFSANHSWHDIIAPAGWACVGLDGDTDGSKWRHPSATSEASATVRHGQLFVYSPNTDFEPTEDGDPHGYTRFRAWAILEHGGDLSAAARAARELRDGPQFDPSGILTETRRLIAERKAAAWVPPPTPQDWPAPMPLAADNTPPPWPVDVLPDWMAAHCSEVAHRMQVPVDVACQVGLGVVATILQGRIKVQITGSWIEHVNLYTATAMASGSGKSPAYSAMVKPLVEFERERRELGKQDRRAAEARKKLAKQAERDARTEQEMVVALAALQDAEVPPEPRLLVDDVTPEQLTVLLGEHKRLGMLSPEADVLDKVCGAYADGRQPVSLNVYLKAWSGEEIRRDRRGQGQSEATYITEPLLTVAITVQPVMLEGLRRAKELEGRGFLARFMWSLPPDLRGYRDRTQVLGPALVTGDTYRERILQLAQWAWSFTNPATLRFSSEAVHRFVDWLQASEGRLRKDMAEVSEWAAKQQATVARVAALLHVADGRPTSEPVALATIERAIAVGEYWTAHARIATDMWGGSSEDERATHAMADWVMDLQADRFSLRESYAHNRRQFPTAEAAVAALSVLAGLGWVRTEDGSTPKAGRRGTAGPVFVINPRLGELRAMRVARREGISLSDEDHAPKDANFDLPSSYLTSTPPVSATTSLPRNSHGAQLTSDAPTRVDATVRDELEDW